MNLLFFYFFIYLNNKENDEKEKIKKLENKEEINLISIKKANINNVNLNYNDCVLLSKLNINNCDRFNDLIFIVLLMNFIVERQNMHNQNSDQIMDFSKFNVNKIIEIFLNNLKNQSNYLSNDYCLKSFISSIIKELKLKKNYNAKEFFIKKNNPDYNNLIHFVKNNIFKMNFDFSKSQSYSKYVNGDIGVISPYELFENFHLDSNNVFSLETEEGTFIFYLTPINLDESDNEINNIIENIFIKNMQYFLYDVYYC